MNRSKKIFSTALIVIILATLAFIWGNSLKDIPASREQSSEVVEIVKPILEPIVGKGNVTNHLVRKLAHFAEYGLLGCELMLLLIFRERRKLQHIINCLFAGLSAALIDETIQIFYDRGSQVQDVWLDFAGVATGVVFISIVFGVIGLIRNRCQTPKK